MSPKAVISFYQSTKHPPFRGFDSFCRKTFESCIHSLKKLPLKAPESFRGPIELELCCVGETRMAQLNKQTRKRSKTTDILSFRYPSIAHPSVVTPQVCSLVLCPKTIQHKWRDRIRSHSLKQVYRMLLIHGFTHLLGFDHEHPKDALKMEQIEQHFMLKWSK